MLLKDKSIKIYNNCMALKEEVSFTIVSYLKDKDWTGAGLGLLPVIFIVCCVSLFVWLGVLLNC